MTVVKEKVQDANSANKKTALPLSGKWVWRGIGSVTNKRVARKLKEEAQKTQGQARRGSKITKPHKVKYHVDPKSSRCYGRSKKDYAGVFGITPSAKGVKIYSAVRKPKSY